jgi:hypothetical protein
MTEENYTIVYVLTNPSMPGIVKIGRTDRSSIDQRLRELYTTGVPVPFDCFYACKVHSSLDVEKNLHRAFDPNRVNPQREFFEIDPDQAKVILVMLAIEDVTPQVKQELAAQGNEVDRAAAKRLQRKRRPPMNYSEMGVPIGAVLTWKDGGYEVTIANDRKVLFNNAESSLTRITSDILGRGYDVQPAQYWLYGERNLLDIYNETYDENFQLSS